MTAYPSAAHPAFDLYDGNEDDDETVVSPSPFLSMVQDAYEDAVTHPAARAFAAEEPFDSAGHSSDAVHHTFTEPLRGYPSAAAYVPRHFEAPEESELRPCASIAALPATVQMPQVVQALPTPIPPSHAPAPIYGPGVVFEGHQPLVAEEWSIRFASDDAPAEVPATAAAPRGAGVADGNAQVIATPGAPRELRGGWAVFGALLGALAGALLWAGIGWATGGWEFKYGAIVIGFMTGAGAARLAGGHSAAVGILGAVFGLAGILTGKALFEIVVQPTLSLGEHLAYHLTAIDLVFYVATIVTGYVVGAGAVAPGGLARRGRHLLRRITPRVPNAPSL